MSYETEGNPQKATQAQAQAASEDNGFTIDEILAIMTALRDNRPLYNAFNYVLSILKSQAGQVARLEGDSLRLEKQLFEVKDATQRIGRDLIEVNTKAGHDINSLMGASKTMLERLVDEAKALEDLISRVEDLEFDRDEDNPPAEELIPRAGRATNIDQFKLNVLRAIGGSAAVAQDRTKTFCSCSAKALCPHAQNLLASLEREVNNWDSWAGRERWNEYQAALALFYDHYTKRFISGGFNL